MSTFPQKKIDILGIGASTLDRFIVVDHYPTGREVQQVLSSTNDGGGPVATALAVAGKYGARTAMIDSIGDDMVGRHILDDFKKYNVNALTILTISDSLVTGETTTSEERQLTFNNMIEVALESALSL